jgi:hypothetical protein
MRCMVTRHPGSDLKELRVSLLASKDPKERAEIKETINEILHPESLKVVAVPRLGPTGLELYKRRFAARLDQVMKRKKVTATQLALLSHLPYAFINRVIKGKVYPSHKARVLLARAAGTTRKYLES